MPGCSNQRTSERAQLLAAMTHPRVKSPLCSEFIRRYKFLIRQSTGIKADPSQVARDLRNARTESGKRRFSIDEFLTPQQIKSYFSRKAAKTKQVVADEEATELAQKDHQTYSSARETIIRECQIERPIMSDTYDVCKLYSEGKLTKLNVALLRHFSIFFSMDVDGLSQHRKAHHIYLLSGNWCCHVHALNVKNSIMNFIE